MGKSGRRKKATPGGKRRHGGGGNAPRSPPGIGLDLDHSDSDQGGVLRIGGVVVRVDASGTGTAHLQGHRRQRRRGSSGSGAASPRRRVARGGGFGSGSHGDESSGAGSSGGASAGDEEEAEAVMRDYLENLAAAQSADDADGLPSGGPQQDPRASSSSGSQADGEGEGGSAAKRRRRDAQAEREVLRRFSAFDMGDEGPVEDLGWAGLLPEEDDSDGSSDSSRLRGASGSESDDDGSSGSSSGSSNGSSSEGDNDEELLEAEDLEQLSLVQRYPVQARPRAPPLPGQQQPSGRKKQRPGVKGAKGGKLAPGEKKRLKHERRQAKRAARAAARGLDLPWVSRQLEEFVLRQGDVQTFGPYGKHGCRAVARVAALYGCRCSLQGGKAGRKLVLVAATPRTCLPQGQQLLELGRVLAAQNAAERSGAALDGRLAAAVAGQDLSSLLPPSLVGEGDGGRRWTGVRRGGAGPRGEAGSAANKGKKGGKLKPVAFVSVGAINPEDAVEVAAPASAAAAAAAALDAEGLASSDEEMAAPGPEGGAAAGPAAPSGGGSRDVSDDGGDAEEAWEGTAAAGLQLLEVVEDLSGSEAEEERQEWLWPARATPSECEERGGGAHAGLGSAGATYTRLTELSLSPGGAGSTRGSAAAQGITNPGRLLGLGLALGIGAEVFGAPGPADSPAGTQPDLSPLSPLLSKSQARKLQRAAARAAERRAPGPAAGEVRPAQHKPGRSKAERRARGRIGRSEGSAEEGEGARRHGGLGAGGDSQPGPSGGADGGDGERGLVAGDYGDFERHTTGIGSRLLAKWGFAGEGAGLGRQQQGRAEPLQAVRRAKKLGLGAER